MDGQGFCGQLLDAATVQLLQRSDRTPNGGVDDGSGDATCVWPSSTMVQVLLAAGTALSVDSKLTLANGTIGSAQHPGSAPFSSGSIRLSMPPAAEQPVVQLSGPGVISPCETSTEISTAFSSGGGSFGLVYNWSVGGGGGSSTAPLKTYLAGLSPTRSTSIAIPSRLVPIGAVATIYVSAQSAVGLTSPQAEHILHRLSSPLPTVAIDGSRYVHLPSTALPHLFVASGSAPCVSSVRLQYSWSVSRWGEDGSSLTVATSSSPTLLLDAYALEPGSTYVVVVVAKTSDTLPLVSPPYIAEISVGSAALVARLSGGDARLASVSDEVTLDASASHDPNLPPSLRPTDASLGVVWSCFAIRETLDPPAACVDASGALLALPARTKVTIPPGGLPVGSYLFSVTLAKAGRESAMASTLLSFQELPVPIVLMDSLPESQHVPSHRLVLRGRSVPPGVTYRWRSLAVDGDEGSGSYLNIEADGVVGSPTDLPTLVVNPGTIAGGAAYAFELSATDENSGATGRARLIVQTNLPPWGGELHVDPPHGVELQTTFSLSLTGWADEPEHLPLSYTFAAVRGLGDSEKVTPLRLWGATPTTALMLTLGVSLIKGKVRNVLGGTSTVRSAVSVRGELNGTTAMKAVEALLSGGGPMTMVANLSDADGELQLLLISAQLLNRREILPPTDAAAAFSQASVKALKERQAARTLLLRMTSASLVVGTARMGNIGAEIVGARPVAASLLQSVTAVAEELDGDAIDKSLELTEALLNATTETAPISPSEASNHLSTLSSAYSASTGPTAMAGVANLGSSSAAAAFPDPTDASTRRVLAIRAAVAQLSAAILVGRVPDEFAVVVQGDMISLSSQRHTAARLGSSRFTVSTPSMLSTREAGVSGHVASSDAGEATGVTMPSDAALQAGLPPETPALLTSQLTAFARNLHVAASPKVQLLSGTVQVTIRTDEEVELPLTGLPSGGEIELRIPFRFSPDGAGEGGDALSGGGCVDDLFPRAVCSGRGNCSASAVLVLLHPP